MIDYTCVKITVTRFFYLMMKIKSRCRFDAVNIC